MKKKYKIKKYFEVIDRVVEGTVTHESKTVVHDDGKLDKEHTFTLTFDFPIITPHLPNDNI